MIKKISITLMLALCSVVFKLTAADLTATDLSAADLTASKSSRRIALIQMSFEWGDTGKNIASVERKIASIEGCDMVILPELFISGCDMQRRAKEEKVAIKVRIAAEYPALVERMKRWAAQSGAVVVGSTIFQQGELFYNRLIAAFPNGGVELYDKHNCFKMGSFSAGDEHLVIDVNGHRFATYICYDLRFSEWSHNDGRYDTAIYIANWPESRAKDWRGLLSERAAENRAHVIGVNCVGQDPTGVNFIGESSLYNPLGELVAKCRDGAEEILIVNY